MPSLTIADATLADLANPADRIPVSQGDGEAKTITVEQILSNAPPYDLFSNLTETVGGYRPVCSSARMLGHNC